MKVKTQFNTENAKKHCFLAAAILLFIDKLLEPIANGLPESFWKPIFLM